MVSLRKTSYGVKIREADRNYQRRKRAENVGYKTKEYALYKRKYPDKVRAHQALNRAVRSGKIKRSPCVDCGSTHRIHGHHPDYSKPYEVIWLCPLCHKNYH